jgi:hypothetical protein
MACCSWLTDRSVPLMRRILCDMFTRFTLRLSLNDDQLVLLQSLKVTLVIAILPI